VQVTRGQQGEEKGQSEFNGVKRGNRLTSSVGEPEQAQCSSRAGSFAPTVKGKAKRGRSEIKRGDRNVRLVLAAQENKIGTQEKDAVKEGEKKLKMRE